MGAVGGASQFWAQWERPRLCTTWWWGLSGPTSHWSPPASTRSRQQAARRGGKWRAWARCGRI
eukprot:53011-Eustigmatos_ZCMA.PRE.1